MGERRVNLAASRVCIGAFAKGRSSSKQLNGILRSTKHNPADHPTRFNEVPPPKAAEIAAQNDITIYTIGVGDPAAAGEAPLDEQSLRQIAEATGGQYFRAIDLEELDQVYQRLDELEPLEFESYSYRPRYELYQWAIGAFLVFTLSYHLLMGLWTGARSLSRNRTEATSEPVTGEATTP